MCLKRVVRGAGRAGSGGWGSQRGASAGRGRCRTRAWATRGPSCKGPRHAGGAGKTAGPLCGGARRRGRARRAPARWRRPAGAACSPPLRGARAGSSRRGSPCADPGPIHVDAEELLDGRNRLPVVRNESGLQPPPIPTGLKHVVGVGELIPDQLLHVASHVQGRRHLPESLPVPPGPRGARAAEEYRIEGCPQPTECQAQMPCSRASTVPRGRRSGSGALERAMGGSWWQVLGREAHIEEGEDDEMEKEKDLYRRGEFSSDLHSFGC